MHESPLEADLTRLKSLLSPLGVLARVAQGEDIPVSPPVVVADAWIGSGQPGIASMTHVRTSGRSTRGDAEARLIALAEGAERYASRNATFGLKVRRASAIELHDKSVDVEAIPRCADSEYADPGCPVVPFDRNARIRWVAGLDLWSGKEVMIPLVMASHFVEPEAPERFWPRLSTGSAVHSDPIEAVLRGLFEVIERDALAITWLQRLSIPQYRPPNGSQLETLIARCDQCFLGPTIFNMTTDIEVPAAVALLVTEHDPDVRCIVGSAAGRDLEDAARSALLSAIMTLPRLQKTPRVPDEQAIREVGDGARFLADPSRRSEFAFLLDGGSSRVARPEPQLPEDPAAALRGVIDALHAASINAYVVGLTTSELQLAGLTAVKVVVPGLQPLSLTPKAQYKGSARLYSAPAAMGMRTRGSDALNQFPPPLA